MVLILAAGLLLSALAIWQTRGPAPPSQALDPALHRIASAAAEARGELERLEAAPPAEGSDPRIGGPKGVLLVLSGTTEDSLVGASLREIDRDGVIGREVTSVRPGLFALAAGEHRLLASAPDHSDQRIRATIREGEVGIATLVPLGAIRCDVVDELGRSAVGVRLQLLPPEPGGKADDVSSTHRTNPASAPPRWTELSSTDSQQATIDRFADALAREIAACCREVRIVGEDGVVEWISVPVARGYRIEVDAECAVRVDPPHDAPAYVGLPGDRFTPGPGPVRDRSGPLEIRIGRSTPARVTCFESTGVRGFLDYPSSAHGVTAGNDVVLLAIDEHWPNDKNRVVEYREEAISPAGQDGYFEILGIEPGTKEISGLWRDDGDELFLYQRQFELTEGVVLDLGVIRSDTSCPPVAIRIGFANDIPASAALPGLTGPSCSLIVSDARPGPESDSALSVLGAAPLESPIVVHGLSSGRWEFRADHDFEWPQFPDGYLSERSYVERFVTLPTTQIVELEFDLEIETERVSFRFDVSGPVEPERIRGVLEELGRGDDGRRIQITLRPERDRDDGAWVDREVLPRGEWRAALFSKSYGYPGQGTGLFVETVIRVPSGIAAPVSIDLRPGAAIQGVVRDRGGAPVGRKTVSFGVRPGSIGVDAPNCWVAKTDEEGQFRIVGLPPNVEIVSSHLKASTRTGPPGSTTTWDAVLDR